MPTTETIEVVRHHTSIYGLTTRMAVVDTVATASIALPSSSDQCTISYSHDVAMCTRDFTAIVILLIAFFLIVFSSHICYKLESQREVVSLIDDFMVSPLKDWKEIVDKRAKSLVWWGPPEGRWIDRKYRLPKPSKFEEEMNAMELENNCNDYVRGVRGLSKSTKVLPNGTLSPRILQDYFGRPT